jgi:AraC-like DNA-binding protein
VSVLPGEGLRFARYPADPALRGVVESYWTLDVERPPATVTVLPDGLIDVTFVVGPRPAAYVTGAVSSPQRYVHDRPVALLGLSLEPGTAPAVLGVEVAALPDGWTPLAEIAGPVADELAARVAQEPPGQPRLALLDTFLAARLRRAGRPPDDRVSSALAAVVARAGDVDVARLAHESAASPRHLGRLFDAWVGVGPKRFARIVRVQAALRRLIAEPGADLAALAAELGFADHAHLTREVRDLTGEPPSALARRLRADDPAVSFKRPDSPPP